jgi:putative ABC transport system ATP-binding protein
MSAAEAAIEVNGLKFAYGNGGPILDIPALRLERGERAFLHGPSGSGKTTLLGVLAGILPVSTGQVRVLGRDYSQLRGQARDRFRGSHIGYVFQMFNLIPYLNVRQNIQLPLGISPERAARVKGDQDEAARLLAAHLGIEALLDRPVTELSVGQQQRVAAARALIGAPELVIADEPTSALDHDHREAFLKVLFAEAEASGSTVIFVSHDHTLKSLFPKVVSLREVNRASKTGGFG